MRLWPTLPFWFVLKPLLSQRFLVLEPLPKDTEGINNLTELMYQRMQSRENDAVRKIKEVIDFATTDDCVFPDDIEFYPC